MTTLIPGSPDCPGSPGWPFIPSMPSKPGPPLSPGSPVTPFSPNICKLKTHLRSGSQHTKNLRDVYLMSVFTSERCIF